MCDSVETPTRSASGQFLPGRSGNPAGRPLGARNKASVLADMLDESESAAIVRAVVDRALAGEGPALRACFSRLLPRARQAPVEIELPEIATLTDVAEAGAALIAAVAAGGIAPLEAKAVMALLVAQTRILEAEARRHPTGAHAGTADRTPVARTAAPSPSATAGSAPQDMPEAPTASDTDRLEPCISPVSRAVVNERAAPRFRLLPSGDGARPRSAPDPRPPAHVLPSAGADGQRPRDRSAGALGPRPALLSSAALLSIAPTRPCIAPVFSGNRRVGAAA